MQACQAVATHRRMSGTLQEPSWRSIQRGKCNCIPRLRGPENRIRQRRRASLRRLPSAYASLGQLLLPILLHQDGDGGVDTSYQSLLSLPS